MKGRNSFRLIILQDIFQATKHIIIPTNQDIGAVAAVGTRARSGLKKLEIAKQIANQGFQTSTSTPAPIPAADSTYRYAFETCAMAATVFPQIRVKSLIQFLADWIFSPFCYNTNFFTFTDHGTPIVSIICLNEKARMDQSFRQASAVSETKAPKPSEPRCAPKILHKFKSCTNMVISKIDTIDKSLTNCNSKRTVCLKIERISPPLIFDDKEDSIMAFPASPTKSWIIKADQSWNC